MTDENTSHAASTRVSDASTRFFALHPEAAAYSQQLPPNDPAQPYSWYPMYVKYRKELSVQQVLEAHDFRTFIPMEEYHVKRGSSVHTERRPAIHNLIFVYSFRQRISWMKMFNRQCQPLQYMSRPLLDGSSEVLTVTDKAMDNIIRAATLDDPRGQRTYIDRPLGLTDINKPIRFISGTFKGIEGIIKRIDKNRAMIIPLAQGISMKITITSASDIEFL